MNWSDRIERVDEYRWRIPRDEQAGMRTDVRVYASRPLLDQIAKDRSLEQAVNVAMLPGIVGSSLAMPDIHQGYGFPIGGVAATDAGYGVVSPGGVGFDINCGVRLVRTNLEHAEVAPKIRELVNQVFRDVPCGTGGSGFVKVSPKELDRVLETGASWMVSHGYGEPRDAEFAEAGGALPGADADQVSERAKERGRPQLGTLGSGNHFLEIQYVERVEDPAAAQRYGVSEGPSGSAGAFRLARAGPPGLHRLPARHGCGHEEVRHPDSRPPTGVCAGAVERRAGVPGRHACRGQFRLGEPAGHHAFPPRRV